MAKRNGKRTQAEHRTRDKAEIRDERAGQEEVLFVQQTHASAQALEKVSDSEEANARE